MKSILLIGLGRFGKFIAMKLHTMGHQVMAVDTSEERVNALLPYVTNAQIGDTPRIHAAVPGSAHLSETRIPARQKREGGQQNHYHFFHNTAVS